MLSYKEYKLLNESLYGAFNLGLRSQGTVGGIVSSGVNGTEAAIEAEAEEAIEEAKMKKKMDVDEPEEDEEDVEVKDSDESEEEHKDEDDDSEEESEDEEDSEDEDEEEEGPKFMKKKSKKEWSEIVSDLEAILEDISDEEALHEIKIGLETIKEGMKKGCGSKMMNKKCGKYMSEEKKHHKSDCGKEKDHDEDKGGEGLTAAQKKLPKALQDAILAKKGKKKGDKEDKKMNEDEAAWWNSVNNMLGSNPDQKNWDGGWSEIKDVEVSVRDEERSV